MRSTATRLPINSAGVRPQFGDAVIDAGDAAVLCHQDALGRGLGELLHDLEVAAVRAGG